VEFQSEGELVNQVDKDIRIMLIKPDAPRPEDVAVRVWPRAIPQFNVGHFDILRDARKALDDAGLPGLFLGGNYVAGVSLGQCIEGAYECSKSISQLLKEVSSLHP
jgi:oxygen-dependent protoporphyrinogen oxidase